MDMAEWIHIMARIEQQHRITAYSERMQHDGGDDWIHERMDV